MPNATIRPAQSDDLPYLVDATLELDRLERSDNPVALRTVPDFPERVRAWLEQVLTEHSALLLVAESDGMPAGFILGHIVGQPNPFTAYGQHGVIQIVWINADARGLGIASTLVHAMESCFRELEVPYCEIQHAANNHGAEGFWQAGGYQPDHITRRKFL